jgi:hypothetical protein
MQDKRCSIWHLIAGLIMLFLGILIWANPMSSLLATAFYLGLVLFLLGCGYVTFSLSQYSGWYMVVGLFDIFIGLILLESICFCVDSPQSNSMVFPNALRAIEGWFLSFEWTADAVPKNVISIIKSLLYLLK